MVGMLEALSCTLNGVLAWYMNLAKERRGSASRIDLLGPKLKKLPALSAPLITAI